MALTAGTRLGHYEILSVIGQGGMGVVHAARDTRLDRTVAIKIIDDPAPDLRERFAREARAVASLQHPHICTLYDIGSHEGTEYLVMEHIEGEPLAGPLPAPRVIAYGIQIADAIDAAHRKGVTHRDLKPSNILVTKSGVKVLDFGIAHVAGLETVTGTGTVVGTPAYMAPEQWSGRAADARSDIYGLGRLLLEMATGRSGPDQHVEPPELDAIVQGCLAGDPDDRWQSARDVRRMLEVLRQAPPRPALSTWRTRPVWLALALGVAVAIGALAAWLTLRSSEPAARFRLSLAPPAGSIFVVSRNVDGGLELSPDGQWLAFVASTAGHVQLWLRRLDSFEARPIPGTDGAYAPFWSPDSRQIAFYTPDRLKRVTIDGGPVEIVCQTDPRSAGGAWMADDVLIVTGRPGGGIHRIAATGGESVRLGDGHWPHALPDRRRFLYAGADAIRIASLDRPEESRALAGIPRGRVLFSQGHVLFARDRTIVAQPFDPDRPASTGVPVIVAHSLVVPLTPAILSQPSFSATADGMLVYAAGDLLSRLRWRDRRGKILGDLGEPARYYGPRISPDGLRVAVTKLDERSAGVWIADRQGGEVTRLTFDPESDQFPIWSADGKAVTYTSGSVSNAELFRRPADGAGSEQKLSRAAGALHAMDWSADGNFLLFTQNTATTGTDLFVQPADSSRAPDLFLQSDVSEAHSQFDPGAPPRWIVYSSDASGGRREIYVAPFVPGQPATATRWQISTGGGTMPRWRRDGKEIYYWALDGWIMAVPVDGSTAAFRAGQPLRLFPVHPPTMRTNRIEFDVADNGARFLVLEPSEQAAFQALAVVTRWPR